MDAELDLSKDFSSLGTYVGESVSITGLMVFAYEICWLIPLGQDWWDRSNAVLLDSADIQDYLDVNGLLGLGGHLLYAERAVIKGHLRLFGDRGFGYILTDVSGGVITTFPGTRDVVFNPPSQPGRP